MKLPFLTSKKAKQFVGQFVDDEVLAPLNSMFTKLEINDFYKNVAPIPETVRGDLDEKTYYHINPKKSGTRNAAIVITKVDRYGYRVVRTDKKGVILYTIEIDNYETKTTFYKKGMVDISVPYSNGCINGNVIMYKNNIPCKQLVYVNGILVPKK